MFIVTPGDYHTSVGSTAILIITKTSLYRLVLLALC